jgi:hypothetical protein
MSTKADSSQVTFQQDGVGSIQRTVDTELKENITGTQFSTISQAIAFAKLTEKRVCIMSDTVIRVPEDALTMQDAFDFTYTADMKVGVIVRITAGHVIATGLSLTGGDYSNYTIQKQSGSYSVNAAFIGDIFYFNNCRAPIIDILINAGGAVNLTRGIVYTNTAIGTVAEGAGITNVTHSAPGGSFGNGLFAERASSVNAINTVFTGNNLRNVHITTGSTANLSGSNLSAGTGDQNVFISRASRAVLDGANISGSVNGNGLVVLRSRVACVPFSTGNMNISNNALCNIIVQDNGTLFAGTRLGTFIDASNAGTTGLQVYGAGVVDIGRVNLDSCGEYGILATEGATVNAPDASIIGCARAVLSSNSARVEIEGAVCTGSTIRGIEARRGGSIGAIHVNSRMIFEVDGADDVVVGAGGIIANDGGLGGLNVVVNSLTGSGIIFR